MGGGGSDLIIIINVEELRWFIMREFCYSCKCMRTYVSLKMKTVLLISLIIIVVHICRTNNV